MLVLIIEPIMKEKEFEFARQIALLMFKVNELKEVLGFDKKFDLYSFFNSYNVLFDYLNELSLPENCLDRENRVLDIIDYNEKLINWSDQICANADRFTRTREVISDINKELNKLRELIR